LRVAQLIETLAAGGAEALAVQIANAWAERGHESHLIVLSAGGPFQSRLSEKVKLHDLGLPPSRQSTLKRAPSILRALKRLEGIIAANGIDTLQTHLPLANFFGLVMGWRGACRVYPTIHNNREFDYGEASGPLRESLRRYAYKRMLSVCARMIAVSDQVKTAMVRELDLPPTWIDRITVVPNGVAIPPEMGPGERSRARAEWGLAEDEVLIACIGRLTAQKNFQALVGALGQVDAAVGPWRCVVAGEGEMRDELTASARAGGLEEKIIFAGHVANVGELLGAADVFCLPSRFEGLPLALLEAMAAGLPTAAFAIDGVTDVVEDGGQALLAEPENIPQLARDLSRLMNDAALRRRLGGAARDLVGENYGFDRVVDQLEEVCGV